MSEPAINSLPKGAVPQPHDARDLQASFVVGAPVVDWSHEFRLPEPPDNDQGSSLSCVAQAWSYYHWQLRRLYWSRRDIYSQIYLPQGGAYLRDGGRILTTFGQADQVEGPDPEPHNYTEAAMRSRAGITREEEIDGVEAGYYAVNGKSIDAVAAAVRDFKGCIIGVHGTNAGWKDLLNPRPPKDGDPGEIWGHALYAFGFHMHAGQKCIVCKSSWCGTGVKEHHIKADYFQSGNTFDGWTLIPKEQLPMYERFKVFHKATGREGVLVVGESGFTDSILWAKNKTMLDDLMKQYEVPVTAVTITL
jgi:hypothetical protein